MEEWECIIQTSKLPKDINIDSQKPIVIPTSRLSQNNINQINSNCFVCKSIFKDISDNSCFVLEKYGKDYWLRWQIIEFNTNFINEETSKYACDHSKISHDKSANINWNEANINTILKSWNYKYKPNDRHETNHNNTTVQLNMIPPDIDEDYALALSKHAQQHTNDKNPRDYIQNKYISTLFSLDVPLAYFVKSSLVRFQNMCKLSFPNDSNTAYVNILSNLVLSMKNFDEKHRSMDLLSLSESNDYIFCTARDKCLSKYQIRATSGGFLSQRAQDLCLSLKAREIKLQMIILLEILYQTNLDNNFMNFEKAYTSKLKKRTLNITRMGLKLKRSRGTSNPKVEKSQTQSDEGSAIDYCEQLDLYLDKLSILEILLESEITTVNKSDTEIDIVEEYKRFLLNKTNEASSSGFTRYILIPYFSKKVPNTVKFIIHKIKGPSLKSTNISIAKKKPASNDFIREPRLLRDINPGIPSETSSLSSMSTEHERYSRPNLVSRPTLYSTSMSSLTSNLLGSRTDSNLSEFLEADYKTSRKVPSSLSRTTSDLAMNNLHRRQLKVEDFSSDKIKRNLAQRGKTFVGNSKPFSQLDIVPSAHISFRRVGKQKESSSDRDISKSVDTVQTNNANTIESASLVQVLATPLSKRGVKRTIKDLNLHNIIESPPVKSTLPTGSILNMSNDKGSLLATPPVKEREDKMFSLDKIIEATPINKSRSIVATPNDKQQFIASPPVKKKVRRRLFGP